MPLTTTFAQDHQGRTFSDVMNDPRIDFNAVLVFFDDPDRQQRMIESEVHHDRPALAGVVRELEMLPTVHAFFENNDAHTTRRFRQAVGVIVRIVMEGHGWRTTGRKGSLGTRMKVVPGTTTPGAYRNSGGLATWFTRAERYSRSDKYPGDHVPFVVFEDLAKAVGPTVHRGTCHWYRNRKLDATTVVWHTGFADYDSAKEKALSIGQPHRLPARLNPKCCSPASILDV